MNELTSLLYARPSFLTGIARIFDVTGGLDDYNASETSEQADERALKSDWYTVGDDIQDAMVKVNQELSL